MNTIRSLSVALSLLAGLAACGAAMAQDKQDVNAAGKSAPGQLLPAAGNTDPAWLAKATAEYPLTTCTVSGDKLGGDMGPPADYIYRQQGKPDRLVRFCCKDCLGDFTKDPAKYLKMIDDAAAAKSKEMGAGPMK
ncbi:MAG: hypothetical protein ABSA05_03635 [Opitutaceae bacterium]